MIKLKTIHIKNFRSIRKADIHVGDMNVFVGLNDVGKSNVLKALNLFFNEETDFGRKYDYETDFHKPAKRPKKKLSIEITLTFQYTTTKGNTEAEVIWEKHWEEGSDSKEIRFDSDASEKTKARPQTRDIKYRYVPAVKDRNFMSWLTEKLYEVLSRKVKKNITTSTRSFTKAIAVETKSLVTEIKDALGITSELRPPQDFSILFRSLEFETLLGEEKGREHKVVLAQRGDGVQARHISSILYFIAKLENSDEGRRNYQYTTTIWGYEEPENSLEMKAAEEEANRFKGFIQVLKNPIQIFLTTHSPAFYYLGKDAPAITKVFWAKKERQKSDFDQQKKIADIDFELGIVESLRRSDGFNNHVKNLIKNAKEEKSKVLLFVEGETDKKIFDLCLDLFDTELEKYITVIGCNTGNLVKGILGGDSHNRNQIVVGVIDKDNEKTTGWEKEGLIILEPPKEKEQEYKHKDKFCLEDLYVFDRQGNDNDRIDLIKKEKAITNSKEAKVDYIVNSPECQRRVLHCFKEAVIEKIRIKAEKQAKAKRIVLPPFKGGSLPDG